MKSQGKYRFPVGASALAMVAALSVPCLSPRAWAEASLECSAGPIDQVIGGTRWHVFGCADGRTLVIYASRGNPASPFYFILHPQGDGYRIYGEGTGDSSASAAAAEELEGLSRDQIESLLSEVDSL